MIKKMFLEDSLSGRIVAIIITTRGLGKIDRGRD
jgi:hypothetical protein